MTVTARRYTSEPGFTDDFFAVREFLVRINADRVTTPGFLWGRWEWAFCLPYLDTDALGRIGVWESDGEVVGLVTYEEGPGDAYLAVDPAQRGLLPELVDHALTHLRHDGAVRLMVPDSDRDLQRIAHARGLRATDGRDGNSVLDLTEPLEYTLPDGYRVISLAEDGDTRRFNRLLWRGFGHPGDAPETPEQLEWRRLSMTGGPGLVPELNITVVAPDGEYAAYCGVWHDPRTGYALVEPVCTDPEHRLRGCGQAAVLEALRRCAARGATTAYVGSNQLFYYAMGFAPDETGTWWV